MLKFLIVTELNTIQTLYYFLLAAQFFQGSLAILLASLTNLVQLVFAGFSVNLGTMSPILRWIQYITPLNFSLEGMTVNKVGVGLMIKVSPVSITLSTAPGFLTGFFLP